MKSIFSTLVNVGLVVLVLCTSCTSDNPTEELAEAHYLKAVVNGKLFVADESNVVVANNQLHIVATHMESSTSIFFTLNAKDTGTYVLGVTEENLQNNVAGYLQSATKSGYVTTYAAGNIGSVSIEHFDIENKNISGTFNFNAKNSDYQSITIKDGEFQIQY